MKAARSCLQCRQSKRKCIRPGPGECCESCQHRKLKCSAQLRRQTRDHTSSFAEPISSEEQATPPTLRSECENPPNLPWEITVELVEIYLERVHDRPHSIFHPATLRSDLRNGAIGGALLCAICAIGSKFSSNLDRRSLETRLTSEAKRLLQADLENVCLENIQTSILIAALSSGNYQASSEALFVRIAASMAEIIKLDSSCSSFGTITKCETARRVWWSLYIADRWCFSGLGLSRRIEDLGGFCDLPMDEMTFRSLSSDQETLDVPWKPGIWAHLITLVRLYGPIQDLNRRVARGNADTVELNQAFAGLQQRLEFWSEMLPADMQFTIQNLHGYQHNGLGGPFISLHLAYHHYSTLLYFRFLEDKQISSSNYRSYVARCKHHASSFSSLLQLSRQLEGCVSNCPTVGHMTTVSSSVLLHTMLFGDVEELPRARRELSANFEALVELQRYWPATSALINRLMVFQNTCLLSTESHRLDGWMVRFLLEHSLALEERELPFPSSNVEINPEGLSSKAREWRERGRYTNFDANNEAKP